MTFFHLSFRWQLVILSALISTAIIFGFAVPVSRTLRTNQVDKIYNDLRATVYQGVRYQADGTIDLTQLVSDSDIIIFCDFKRALSPTAIRVTSENALANCNPNERFIEFPTGTSTAKAYNQLYSISVWDAQDRLVTAVPATFANQVAQWAISPLQLLSQSQPTNNVSAIPDRYIYRPNSGEQAQNNSGLVTLYTIPLFNADKSEKVGSVMLEIQPEEQQTFGLIQGLLVWFVPLAMLVGYILASIVSSQLHARIARLQQATTVWAAGDFSYRIPQLTQDALGRFGQDLNQMANQLETLIETQSLLAQVDTRQRLARDLHDSAKQQLFAASMQLTATQLLIDCDPAKAKEHAQLAGDLTKQAQRELAIIIEELRPLQLQESDFATAVQQILNGFTTQHQITADLNSTITTPIPVEIENGLFRILQESLSNIAKHSQANHVHVDLATTPETFMLMVQDNGRGFAPHQTATGFGLQSITQRSQKLGGTADISSQPEAGTTIMVHIPVTS